MRRKEGVPTDLHIDSIMKLSRLHIENCNGGQMRCWSSSWRPCQAGFSTAVGGVDSRLNGIVGPMAKRSCRKSHWKAPNVRVGEGGALRSEMPVAKAENDAV